MIYSSLLFIYGFLPVSMLVYYVVPNKFKDAALLFLSMIFCALNSICFLWFMIGYTLLNYTAGLFIERLKRRRHYAAVPLAAGIIIDIMIISMYRADAFLWLKTRFSVPEEIFPVGISFVTLSAIGYLVDVYRQSAKAERNIIRFGLYMMMFPRIIMGPLLRYGVFRKIMDRRRIELSGIGIGFTVFVKGIAKKVIAADSLFMLYTAVKSIDVDELSAFNAWLGITAYFMCLYFTLSGFADMGTGIGYCFGLRLPQSFNYPLFSMKIRDFAARWHIQLIHWFRRYITRPLSELSSSRHYRRFVYVSAWCLAGFWYTFSANGLIWGLLIGVSIFAEKLFKKMKIMNATGIIYTFLLTVIFSVFLSEDSISDSFRYILIMLGGNKVIADSMSLYLIKSYIVILLICVYASTSLFRNMMTRSGKSKVQSAVSIVSPFIVISVLVICTALISYSGSSEMILMRL